MDQRGAGRLSTQELVEMLEADIIFGRLMPRERLVEEALMTRSGAKRHGVRSALAQLEQKGLVVREPNKGASVRAMSDEDVAKIYEMRALLQEAAARRVPMPADPALISALERTDEEYQAAMEKGDLMLVDMLNDRFHAILFSGCGNENLASDIERYAGMVRMIRSYAIGDPALLARSRQDHVAMIDALKQGDRDRLSHLCVDHLWRALHAFRQRAQHPMLVVPK